MNKLICVLAASVALVSAGCDGGEQSGVGAPVLAFAFPGLTPGAGEAAPKGRRGCVPNCRGKTCGTDGCAGSCGTCGGSKICLGNRCVKNKTLDLCRKVAGRWKGVMRTRPYHYLEGRIFVKGKACRARLRVSYQLRNGPAYVVQEFLVAFRGARMHMHGVRISAKSHNSNYNLDRFAGTISKSFKRYSGRNRDVKGSTSYFHLDKK